MAQAKREGVNFPEGVSSPTKKSRNAFFTPDEDIRSETSTTTSPFEAPLQILTSHEITIPPRLKNNKRAVETIQKLQFDFQGFLQCLPQQIKDSPTFKATFSQGDAAAEYIKNSIDAGATKLKFELEKNDTHIIFLIKDNGSGFSNTMLRKDKIFTNFRKDILINPKHFPSTKKSPNFFGGCGKFFNRTSQATDQWQGSEFLIGNIIGEGGIPAGAVIKISIPIDATKKAAETPTLMPDEDEFVIPTTFIPE